MIKIYEHTDYRTIFQVTVDERKDLTAGYKYSDFANAIQVQAPYLSRVFRKIAHLTSDQVHLACQELEFSDDESQYIFLLMEYQKTGLTQRREQLKEKIAGIQNEKLDTKNYLTAEVINTNREQQLFEYYLEPLAPVIHSFLNVPEYQRNPDKISMALGCSGQKVRETIVNLEKMGLVQYQPKQKKYISLQTFLHLDKRSSLNKAYQNLTRSLSGEHLNKTSEEHKHQYTVTVTTDEATAQAIYINFNKFIKSVEKKVNSSTPNGVYQLSFDFFRWDPSHSSASYFMAVPDATRDPSNKEAPLP